MDGISRQNDGSIVTSTESFSGDTAQAGLSGPLGLASVGPLETDLGIVKTPAFVGRLLPQ